MEKKECKHYWEYKEVIAIKDEEFDSYQEELYAIYVCEDCQEAKKQLL